MPDKRWKAVERAIANRFGGERAGPSGRTGPDIKGLPWLAIEIKDRQSLPQWILSALAQVCNCARAEQLPIVVLHQKGSRHDSDLVLMRLRDFEEQWGAIEHPAEPPT